MITKEEQDLHDLRRQRCIEKLEPEAQTKMLEAICENLGITLPTQVETIRTIRAADNVGDIYPTNCED